MCEAKLKGRGMKLLGFPVLDSRLRLKGLVFMGVRFRV